MARDKEFIAYRNRIKWEYIAFEYCMSVSGYIAKNLASKSFSLKCQGQKSLSLKGKTLKKHKIFCPSLDKSQIVSNSGEKSLENGVYNDKLKEKIGLRKCENWILPQKGQEGMFRWKDVMTYIITIGLLLSIAKKRTLNQQNLPKMS